MKADPHTTIRAIEQQLHDFRIAVGPQDADRFIREYLNLGDLDHLIKMEDEAAELEDKNEELGRAEGTIENFSECYLRLHNYLRGIVEHCYKNPKDYDSCSAGLILMQIRDCLEESEYIPENLEAKLQPLPKHPTVPLGLDHEDEHSIPGFLIDRIVKAGLIPPETLRAYAREHLADLLPLPSPGPETPVAGAERSAPVPPVPAPPAPAPTPPAPAARLPKKDRPKREVPPATAPPVMTRNHEHQGIELRFNGKPDDSIRDAMKAHGFRWLPRQEGQPWAAKYTEERWVFATSICEQTSETLVRPLSTAESAQLPEAPPPPAAPAPDPQAERSAPAVVSGFAMPDFL